MKFNRYFKIALIAASFALSSCAKHLGHADGQNGLSDNQLSSQGLGDNERFSGQEAGESYTTKAPHNQIYLFSYNDATLANKYVASLNSQIGYLRNHAGARVLIAGHTDERGSREYNIALGERRANTVSEMLRMAGISDDQMRVVSYGKERPACFGHAESCHLQNRRVEFTYEATK